MPMVTTKSGQSDRAAIAAQVTDDLKNAVMMTPKELSKLIKVPTGTLGQWRYRRKGPDWLKLENGHIRYPIESYLEWIERQRSAALSEY